MRASIWSAIGCLAITAVVAGCGELDEPTSPSPSTVDMAGGGWEDRGPFERVQFIHWRKGYAKPGGGGGKPGSSCYAFIASGAHWLSAEPWEVLGSTGSDGINAATVKSNVDAGVQAWRNAETSSFAILGTGSSAGGTPVDLEALDDKNVVQFDDYPTDGVIAVTNVWGIFSGPPRNRRIVEWDMILDTDFTWSTAPGGEAGKMDLLNILAHELGHAMGMGHPSDSCTQETMYRFASEGETQKRDLFTGDIAGINALY